METARQSDKDVNALMDKLGKWVVQQPEFVRIVGLADRSARRRLARAIAKEITTITLRPLNPQPNRATRREMERTLARNGGW